MEFFGLGKLSWHWLDDPYYLHKKLTIYGANLSYRQFKLLDELVASSNFYPFKFYSMTKSSILTFLAFYCTFFLGVKIVQSFETQVPT